MTAVPDVSAPLAPPTDNARLRLLNTAARLFCRYGINAIGIDAIVAEANVAKATLYKAFGSKDGLVKAVLEQEGRKWRQWFLNELDKEDLAPRARLLRIFPLLENWFSQDHFYGCPFINAIAEHDKFNDELRSITLAHKSAILTRIEDLAAQAGAGDASRFAHQLGLLMDGAIIVAMITRNPQAARLAAETATSLIANLPQHA